MGFISPVFRGRKENMKLFLKEWSKFLPDVCRILFCFDIKAGSAAILPISKRTAPV